MCVWFNRELEADIPEGSDDIDYAISNIDQREKQEVRDFLAKALTSDLSDEELEDIWFRGGALVGLSIDDTIESILKRYGDG
jgi:hypothetical protein